MGDDNGFGIALAIVVSIVMGGGLLLMKDMRIRGYATGWCAHAQGTMIGGYTCVVPGGKIVEPEEQR